MAGFLPNCDGATSGALSPLKAWRLKLHVDPAITGKQFACRFFDLQSSIAGKSFTQYARDVQSKFAAPFNAYWTYKLDLAFLRANTTGAVGTNNVMGEVLRNTSGANLNMPVMNAPETQEIIFLTDVMDAPNILKYRVGTIISSYMGPYIIDVDYWDENILDWVHDWSTDAQAPWVTSNELRTFYRPGFTP